MAAPAAAADDDVYLGDVYAWAVYIDGEDFPCESVNIFDIEYDFFPIGDHTVFTNATGQTVTFLSEDDEDLYYIDGNDVDAEGDYYCDVDGTRYHIYVKFPAAEITGSVYKAAGETDLVGALVGSVVQNDRYIVIDDLGEGAVIAFTNPDGTVISIDPMDAFGLDASGNTNLKAVDCGMWTVQACFAEINGPVEVLGGHSISQYAPAYILGKPYYFTIVSSYDDIHIKGLTNEIVQDGYETIIVTAPTGVWNLSVTNGYVPDGEPLMTKIDGDETADYYNISIGSDGVGTFTVSTHGTSNIKIELLEPGVDYKNARVVTFATIRQLHGVTRIIVLSNSSGISEKGNGYVNIASYDGNGNTDSETLIRWRSDNPSVLGISSSSNTHADLKPRSIGTATIYAELASDPSVNASVTYTVEGTIASSINGWCSNYLSWAEVYSTPGKKICTIEIIEGTEVYANVDDQFGISLQYPDIRWEIVSGNDNITLTQESNTDRYAKVVPTKAGSAEIKATSKLNSSLSLTYQITIPPISGYNLDIRSVTQNLTLNAYDGSASAVVRDTTYWHNFPEKRIKWSVDDASIVAVTVENNYDYPTRYVTLTPKSVGTTVLHAELEDDPLVNDSVFITVEETAVTSIYFSNSRDKNCYVGTTWSENVYLTDQYGRSIRTDSGENIAVTSGNSSVVQLSKGDTSPYEWSESLVLSEDSYFVMKAMGEGEAAITASVQGNPSITTSKNIHVTEYVPVDPEPVYDSVVSSIYIDSPRGVSNRSSPSINVNLRDAYGDYINEYNYPKYYSNVEWTVDNKNVLTLSSYSGQCPTIIPNKNAVGQSTTIRAALKSDAAVYDEIKVTIAESVPTSVYIDGNTQMTVNPDRTYWASAYVRDQFDNQLSDSVIWDVDRSDILTITPSSSYGRDVRITAHAAGTAVITAYAESNPSLSQSMTVTVEEPVLTRLYVYSPEGVSLTGSGTLEIGGRDQFGSQMSVSGCTVTVDNESVLTAAKQDNQWSTDYEFYTLTPISEGTAVITVTYGPLKEERTVKVEKGIPSRISADWYVVENSQYNGVYVGYLLLNTNYAVAYAYIYDQFEREFGDTVRWIVDNPEIVDVSSTVSSSGSRIALFPKAEGKTKVYAVSTADESVKTSFTVRVYAEKPTNYTPLVMKGDNISFSGESDAAKLQYYIFGTNYFTFGTVDVVDGAYSKNVSSNGLAAGQYFAVVQNPGEDGVFNITAVGDKICLINADGQNTVLFDVSNRQSANAAQALCDAIQTESIDDTCDEFRFIVTGPTSYINAIPSQISQGEILTISGTTTGHVGEVVSVELLSTAFVAVPKEAVGPASFVSLTTKVGSDGTWEIDIDTTELNADDYTVSVAVGELDAVTAKLTITGEPGVTPTPKKYTSVTPRNSPSPFTFPSGISVENVYVTPESGLVAGQTVIVNADIRMPQGSCAVSDYITLDTQLTDANLEATVQKNGRDFVSLKDAYLLTGFDVSNDYYQDVIVHLRLVGTVDSSAAGTSIFPLTIIGNISDVSTIYSLSPMNVVSGTPLINPGFSDNYVFVYENAGLSGLWYSETSAVTFEDGHIIGSNVEEGVYSCGNQLINITYPTGEVTAVSNSVSCLDDIAAKSSEITFGVTSNVAGYSVGNGLGLMFTAPDGTQTTTFGGVDFNYTNPDAFGTPVSAADVAEGTWHVQAYFNADGTSGHLVTDTPKRYQLGKDVFTFSVGHIGTGDTLYAESEQDRYTIGDDIHLSGYNPTGTTLYFYLKGTNYPLTRLYVSPVSEQNWEVTIPTDEVTTSNGKKLDAGTYTIYAASASGVSSVDDFDDDSISYTAVSVALYQPGISITSAPSEVERGGTLTVEGVAETASEVQYYIFGTNYYCFDSVDVVDDTFTITKPLADTEPYAAGMYYVVVQHPMYDKEFNIWVSGSDVWMSDGYSAAKCLFSLNERQSANAAQALCDALDSQNHDDIYARFSFVISDGSGGGSTNPALTISAPSDVLFGDKFTISGTSDLPGTEVNVCLLGHSLTRKYEGITDTDGNWEVTVDTSALYADSYTITADIGSYRIGCSVTVHEGSYLGLTAPNEIAMSNDGEYLSASIVASRTPGTMPTAQPTAVPTLSPGQTAASDYNYQIDNPDIFDLEAASSSSWRIIPKAYGTANVTVTWKEDGSYTAVKQITVSEKNGVASVTLDYNRQYVDGQILSDIYLTAIDESAWVSASACDANGYQFRNETVTFSSSDVSIMDVETESASGRVAFIHPKNVGEAVLTAVSASNPAASSTVNVIVSKPELSIYCWGDYYSNIDTLKITNGSSSTLWGGVQTQYGNSVAYLDTWDIADDTIVELSLPQYNSNEIIITALSVGETALTMSSSKYPDVSKTVTVAVDDPTLKRVSMDISGSWQMSLDAHSTLTVTARDQYGYLLPDENVTINIVNSSVIDLIPAAEDGTYTIVPKNVGKTDVIAAVKDKVNEFASATISVEKTIPRISGYSQIGGTVLAENGIIYYKYRLSDQFGNLLDWDWDIAAELDAEDADYVDISKADSDGWYQSILKLVRNTSAELTEDKTVSLILKNEEHNLQEIIPITLSKESAEFYGFAVDRRDESTLGILTTDNQMVSYPVKVSVEDGPKEIYVYSVGKIGTVLCYISTPEDFTAESSDEAVVTISESEHAAVPGDVGYIITPKKSGTATLTFKTGQYTLPVEVTVTAAKGGDGGIADIAEPPEITSSNDENGLFSDTTTVTIKTRTEGSHIYYTTDGTEPTLASKLYSKANGFEITDTTVVKAFAVCEGYEDSTVTTAVFTKYSADALPTYKVTIIPSDGGTLTAVPAEGDLSAVPYGTEVTISAEPADGYAFTSWSITGVSTGTIKEKTNKVTTFTVDSEDVNITAVFTEVVDNTPKASSVKIVNIPNIIYTTDTGALNAATYDQFGEKYSDNKVTWTSSAPDVIRIDDETGAYEAVACGYTVITAVSTENPSVNTTCELSVYQPPTPYVNAKVVPTSAYYGIMSDTFNVASTDTTYLNWNWGDDTPVVKTLVAYPYPLWHTSTDAVAHTFAEVGNLIVSVTPSNKYGTGTAETFPVKVTYAPPRNVKITSGPSAVVAGDTVRYGAFATGSDGVVWYLDNIEQSGPTFKIPENYAGEHIVKVSAWKGDKENNAVAEKTIHVSALGGVLGSFGDLITESPAYPAVGEVTVFSIAAVPNATKYVWKFGDEAITTAVPSVSYTLADDTLGKVTVTAYNSAGSASQPKEYTFTKAGYKPVITDITASPANSAPAGTAVTYSAAATGSGALTYKWVVDGKTVSGETSSTYTRLWTDLDVKRHEVAVFVSNGYGDERMPSTYTVTPRPNLPAVIEKISGSSTLKEGEEGTFAAVITSGDDYTVAWYVDNVLMKESASDDLQFTEEFGLGEHTIKLVVITAAEEVSELEKTVIVLSGSDWDKNTADSDKSKSMDPPAEENQVNPRIADNANSDENVISTVGKITLGKDDVSEDASSVSLTITSLKKENLTGFTSEMGSPSDAVMNLCITPNGLKNEKDLQDAALLTFRIAKTDVTGPKSVKFYRLDSGSADGIEKWVELPIVSYESDKNYWVFTVKTSGFSDFVGVNTGYVDNTPEISYNVAVTSTAGGNASASPSSAAEGTLITLTASANSSYTFKEWQVLSGGVTVVNNQFTMPANDVEIHAVFELDKPSDAMYLSSGWNFVSVPKKLAAAYDTAAELFGSVNTSGNAVLSYNAETKLWEQVTASTVIEPLNAYWIYSVEDDVISPAFDSGTHTPAVKNVYAGWNAVGLSAENSMPASAAFNNMAWRTYLSWNAEEQKYNSPIIKGGSGIYSDENHLHLWKGGWVYMTTDDIYLGYA